MRSIGIDIGTYSIKYAEIDFSNKSYSLNAFQEFLLPQDPSVDPLIHIIDALRQIAAKYDTDVDRFVVGIRQEYVCNRNIHFPFKQKFKIENSIPFELEDDLPFDIDDAIIHPKIMSTSGESANVMAFAALKSNIESLIKICNDVGIDPDIVSCEGAALSNFFEAWTKPVKEVPAEALNTEEVPSCTATIYLGHTKSVLAVHCGDDLIALRSIHFGGIEIAKAIGKKYNISIIEALKNLKEKAFILSSHKGVSQDQITFSNLIAANVDTMATEVKRHLISIEAEKKVKVDNIYIAGGAAKILNLPQYLTQCFTLPVNLVENDPRLKNFIFKLPSEKLYTSMIAVGLAIEGARPIKNPPIQFRKEELEKKSQKLQIFFEKWSYTLKTAAVLLAIFFVYSFVRSSISQTMLTQSTVKLRAQATKLGLKGRQATTSALQAYVRSQRQEIKAKELIQDLQSINSPLDIMLELSKVVPNSNSIRLDVRKFNLQENVLRIEGVVDNPAQTNHVKTAIETIAENIQTNRPSIATEVGKTSFSYSARVKRNVGEL